MNTKNIIIWVLVIVGLAGLAWWLYRKYNAARRLVVGFGSFELKKTDLYNALLDGLQSVVTLQLQNYEKTPLKLQQVYFQVFDKQGNLIAEQAAPLASTMDIQGNNTTNIPIQVNIPRAGVVTLLQATGAKPANFIQKLKDYFLTEKLGAEIVVKGYAKAENIPFDFEFTQAI